MRKGIAFIASAQLPDGGFESFSSPAKSPFKPDLTYRTTFGPATILSSLAGVENPEARKVCDALAAWLADQRSPHWSFNYWAKSAPECASLPYPDDLDDTFCSLIALRLHDPLIIDEECLGKVVKLLIAAEQQVGGPYRTWLVNEDAPAEWKDVDLAVNSNVACFLNLVAEPLPRLTALMDDAISARIFKSPYYPSVYPIIYFIARAYTGQNGGALARYLLDQKHGAWWGSPLKTALALLALSSLGQPKDRSKAIAKLLEAQLPDGSWPAEPFCIDPSVNGRTYYSGSAALTTALVVNAIASQKKNVSAPTAGASPLDRTTDEAYRQVVAAAFSEVGALSPDLKQEASSMLRHMHNGDKDHEIVLLPRLFNSSLASPLDPSYSDTLDHLALANLYGWMAYTIYDDFLDGEGQPRQLSAANTALRRSVKHFDLALPDNPRFQKLVAQTFDTIDGANAWELANCRMEADGKAIVVTALPHYSKTLSLADRSLGHTLTPLGVLAAAGIESDSRSAVLVRRALRHYLVARQLNDDMHDWESDLRSGIITFVVASILQELAVAPGKHSLVKLIPKMQRQFWHHTLGTVCAVITRHTALARQIAQSNRLLAQPNIITTLTDKIDASVLKTLEEQSKAQKFLAAYTGKQPTPPADS